jgi:hypothetical protein
LYDIFGIKADAGLGIAIQGRDDHLSLPSGVMDDLTGFNIFNFRQKKGLIDMHASRLSKTPPGTTSHPIFSAA